jgi:hypothetical protein
MTGESVWLLALDGHAEGPRGQDLSTRQHQPQLGVRHTHAARASAQREDFTVHQLESNDNDKDIVVHQLAKATMMTKISLCTS